MIKRHIEDICFDTIFGRQMRFIAGPRQTGKTTLAVGFLNFCQSEEFYFNWDLRKTRDAYHKDPYFFESNLYSRKSRNLKPWICFDEIHKMPKWKNILKDYFDKYEDEAHFVVTGSARMDWFRRSGDSLAGRYFLFHLLPLTLSELVNKKYLFLEEGQSARDFIEQKIESNGFEQEALEQLLTYSGFPEPCLKARAEFHTRWKSDMVDRVIREDIRDITRIMDVENAATLLNLLPYRIGSLLSVNSLREDMGISYSAIKNCVLALEKAYVIFEIPPYSLNINRSIKKEKKCYFYDWTRCENLAAKFENYVAVELKNLVSLWSDKGIGIFDLYFIRTKDGLETDFLVTKDRKPWCLFEVKLKDGWINSHHYKHSKFLDNIPFVQLTMENNIIRKEQDNFYRISASRFF